jgi:hypothetical protein
VLSGILKKIIFKNIEVCLTEIGGVGVVFVNIVT